jgi:hypothetical protein
MLAYFALKDDMIALLACVVEIVSAGVPTRQTRFSALR